MRWPFAPSRLHARNRRVDFRPVRLARLLEMIDFRRSAGIAADGDQLIDRFKELIPLGAHMADVHPAAFAGLGHERRQLRRFGICRRRIDERRANAERAILHRLANKRAHPVKLRRRRVDVLLAKLMYANGGGSDEGRDVRCNALALKVFEILGERRPFYRIFDVAFALEREPPHPGRKRSHGIALAEHLQSDALPSVAHPAPVGDQAFDRPAKHVDEARRDSLAGSVDRSSCMARRVRSDIDNSVALQRDVTDVRRSAKTVINGTAVNEHAVARWRRRGRRSKETSDGKQQC